MLHDNNCYILSMNNKHVFDDEDKTMDNRLQQLEMKILKKCYLICTIESIYQVTFHISIFPKLILVQS